MIVRATAWVATPSLQQPSPHSGSDANLFVSSSIAVFPAAGEMPNESLKLGSMRLKEKHVCFEKVTLWNGGRFYLRRRVCLRV